MKMKRGKKGSFMEDNLGWAITAAAILVIVIISVFAMSKSGQAWLQKVFDYLRFGR